MKPVRFLAMLSDAAEIAQLRMDENRWTSASRSLPSIILFAGNGSAERPRDYFEFAGPAPVEKTASKSAALRKGRAGPPKTLSIMKWVAIGALAAGAFALVMKPKKAY